MSFLLIPIQTYPNTALGYEALTNVVIAPPFSGQNNTAFGDNALKQNTTGYQNVAVGRAALINNTTGNNNTVVGMNAAAFNITGSANTAFGAQAFWIGTGDNNTAIGAAALASVTTGIGNTGVGDNAGSAITTGSRNSILGRYTGNQGGLDIRTLSNYIVLSDGSGNPRLWIDNTGAVNIPGGTVLPGGVANGVLYLNASKVMTSGSALNFNGTRLQILEDNPLLLLSDTDLTIRRSAIQLDTGGGTWSIENNNNLVLKNAAPGAAITTGSFIDLGRNVDPLIFGTSGLERMRLDASGNLGIGTTSTSSGRLTVDSNSGIPSLLLTNSSTGNPYLSFQSGGFIQDLSGGSLRIRAATALGYIDFDTNATRRFRIDNFGNSIFGTAAIATNATNGFVYAPTCAGTPTGIPTAYTGTSPIVIDTTNNKLYFYSGGAWRDAGP